MRLRNPIPAVPKDPSDLRETIEKFKLVPYYGTTQTSSHTFLKLLWDLKELSPSHQSCIEDQKYFSFEGDWDVVKKQIPGLRSDEEKDLSMPEKVEFLEILQELGITFIDIQRLTKRLFVDYKTSGNLYLWVREVETAGEIRYFLKAVNSQEVMYLVPEKDEPKTVLIAKSFEAVKIKDGKYDLVRVYPDWTERRGERETIIHVRNDSDKSDFYGRPDSLASYKWQAVEFETANLAGKIAASEVSAKAILAQEKPPPEVTAAWDEDKEPDGTTLLTDKERTLKSRGRAKAAALRSLLTNEGDDAKSMALWEYPHGGQAPTLLTLDINRDHEYFKTSVEVASDYIYGANRWSKELTGMRQARSGIGSEVMINLFVVKNEVTIKPYQRMIINHVWSVLLKEIAEKTGRVELAERTIEPPDVIGNLVENLKMEPSVIDTETGE